MSMEANNDQLSPIYRQFQQAHTTEANVIEFMYNQLTQQKQMIAELQKKLIEKDKKIAEIQPNSRKIDHTEKKI